MSTTDLPSSFADIVNPPSDLPTPVEPPAAAGETRASRRRRGSAPEDVAPVEAPAKRGLLTRRAPAATVSADDLPIAGYPVAHLLPPEVIARGQVRTTRTLMSVVVVVVLLLSIAAAFGAHAYAQSAQQQLTALEGQNSAVLAQEGKYSSVRTEQSKLQLAQAAQKVGAASSIDWNAYFAKVEALLPAGVTVTDISGQTASPTTAVTQDTAPLSDSRAAIVTVTVSAPSATAIANATDAFSKLPGYAAASIGAMTQGAGGGASAAASSPASASWTAPITISLTQAAFSGPHASTNK